MSTVGQGSGTGWGVAGAWTSPLVKHGGLRAKRSFRFEHCVFCGVTHAAPHVKPLPTVSG